MEVGEQLRKGRRTLDRIERGLYGTTRKARKEWIQAVRGEEGWERIVILSKGEN